MSRKATTNLTLWSAIWVSLTLISTPLIAEEAVSTRTSKSISFSNTVALDKVARDEQLKQTESDVNDALIKTGLRPESFAMAVHVDSTSSTSASDIFVYDASSELISDFNYDGFYHRFSVSVDADTVYETAYVYAKMYLSYEGGPWNHYSTSDYYHIYGASELDRFVIETELGEGFPTGYYDVRIELYDADHDIWVDTYGPYDDADLLELPLEDSYYDEGYGAVEYQTETEIIVSGHGHGAMSWWLLMVPALIALTRQFRFKLR